MIDIPSESLQKFTNFKNFTDVQLEYIKLNSKLVTVPERKVLLKLGATHSNLFFLLNGELRLVAGDGKEDKISHDNARAENPIAQLRPSRYQVTSLTEVTLIVMSEEIFNEAVAMEASEEVIDIQAFDDDDNGDDGKNSYDSILFDILTLLHTDKLVLPSLPDIALKIRKVVEDENSDAEDIVKLIGLDQSIMAQIIMTANSAMYAGAGKKVDTLKAAYVRLGAKNVVNLVVSYTMKKVYNAESQLVKENMTALWQHSIKVAAISSILARLTPGFEADKALLAGLLHNIGAVVVLNNLGDKLETDECKDNLDDILFSLQAEVGSNLLSKWDFPEEIINVIELAGDWMHDDKEEADYIDIINVAQLHAYIGTKFQEHLPNLDEIPAFHKLALGQLTPEMSLQVLEKSQEEIDQTIALFT